MNYEQAIDYIEQTDTPRQRYGLEKLKQALHLMGDPQEEGALCPHCGHQRQRLHCLDAFCSVLNRAGLRCGLYTSPHLQRFNERFQIAGEPISDEQLIQSVQLEPSAGVRASGRNTDCIRGADPDGIRAVCTAGLPDRGAGGRHRRQAGCRTNCIPSPQAAVVDPAGTGPH